MCRFVDLYKPLFHLECFTWNRTLCKVLVIKHFKEIIYNELLCCGGDLLCVGCPHPHPVNVKAKNAGCHITKIVKCSVLYPEDFRM